jgi:hypothetical protein
MMKLKVLFTRSRMKLITASAALMMVSTEAFAKKNAFVGFLTSSPTKDVISGLLGLISGIMFLNLIFQEGGIMQKIKEFIWIALLVALSVKWPDLLGLFKL